MKKIAVFCGSSLGFNEIYQKDAQLLGEYFCKHQISMVYGGGKIGMMGAIANKMMNAYNGIVSMAKCHQKNENNLTKSAKIIWDRML